ncbi:M23 family metallopeptidase [Candidatus Gracilibacteria bacterium]|nr:M23 family metallopeptidase [Candidatus Gracilibacteria bacterium]
MIRHTLSVGLIALLLPGILISEGNSEPYVTPPLEILYSGVTSLDTGSGVLIGLSSGDVDSLTSPCSQKRIILKSSNASSVVQWKSKGRCTLPVVTFQKKNYILPIANNLPEIETLSDVSTTTLENTLKAGSILRTDYKLSSLNIRQFFDNIDTVLAARKRKYSLPLASVSLPTKSTHLPNSPRPFRADSTDGIHHGWDFYTSEGTPVTAIEDGTIIHVKRDFSWQEMAHLHDGDSDIEKQENLDTYRGNTVYLKTVSGHVAIYAHLESIPEDMYEGKRVGQGTVLGHVGGSAVPDKKYLYHLHFELALNPLNDIKAGTFEHTDVLLWPWYGKGKSTNWVSEHDDSLFE